MTHPYKSAPARAFWKRAVSVEFSPETLLARESLLVPGDRVASAGSCFATNLVGYIERAGFEYVRTERRPAQFGDLAEDAFGYSKFSAAYGNIYSVRQFVQLLLRALGRFQPVEDRWVMEDGRVVDPFRPGLRHPATCHAEFDLLTRSHLRRVLDALRRATVFVLTLGMTEAWVSKRDGAVFPTCPGTVAGTFDPAAHAFRNFSAQEVMEDLAQLIALAREVNEALRFIITVSPVPLFATATADHVLIATTYSKAVLRVAASDAVRRHAGCVYFPAYEIVTGPQAPHDYFGPDRREPTKEAIDAVMRAFLAGCETAADSGPPGARSGEASDRLRRELSFDVAAAACEEEAVGR